MLGELLYVAAIALFVFVLAGAAQLPNGIWLAVSLVPVFLALVVGGMMLIVAVQVFPLPVSLGALAVPVAAAFAVRRWSERDLFVAICGAAVLGVICAWPAIQLTDFG